MDSILENLNYFSEVTQRTLSAFHISGTEDDLTSEIDDIKRFITKSKVKKLIKVENLSNNKFKRYFSDNSTDIVNEENIMSPAYYQTKDYEIIEKALSQTITPVSSIKLNNNIMLTRNKKIEKPSEIIFFM